MNGNVSEMVVDQDIVVGGSWKNTGYDVRNESVRPFGSTAVDVGFRTVMIVKEK